MRLEISFPSFLLIALVCVVWVCEILVSSGAGYFKRGQFAYVVGEATYPVYRCEVDTIGSTKEGTLSYLVSKTKDSRGGALWFAPTSVRFTGKVRR